LCEGFVFKLVGISKRLEIESFFPGSTGFCSVLRSSPPGMRNSAVKDCGFRRSFGSEAGSGDLLISGPRSNPERNSFVNALAGLRDQWSAGSGTASLSDGVWELELDCESTSAVADPKNALVNS